MSFSRVKILKKNTPRFPRSRKAAAAAAAPASAAAAAPATITSRANYGGDQDAKLSWPYENYGRNQEKSYKRVVQYGQVRIQDHQHNRYVWRRDVRGIGVRFAVGTSCSQLLRLAHVTGSVVDAECRARALTRESIGDDRRREGVLKRTAEADHEYA